MKEPFFFIPSCISNYFTLLYAEYEKSRETCCIQFCSGQARGKSLLDTLGLRGFGPNLGAIPSHICFNNAVQLGGI